jgi:hypothetical protein
VRTLGGTGQLGTRWVKIALVAACAALAAVSALLLTRPAAGSGSGDDEATAELLREIERTRLQALVDADLGVVAPLLAEGFEVVTPDGAPLTREAYLGAVAGSLDYLAFEPVTTIEVRLYGDAAVLTYRSHLDIVAAGQDRLEHEAWHTYLYERRQGQWQVVWEQATAVGGFPPPQAP